MSRLTEYVHLECRHEQSRPVWDPLFLLVDRRLEIISPLNVMLFLFTILNKVFFLVADMYDNH